MDYILDSMKGDLLSTADPEILDVLPLTPAGGRGRRGGIIVCLAHMQVDVFTSG